MKFLVALLCLVAVCSAMPQIRRVRQFGGGFGGGEFGGGGFGGQAGWDSSNRNLDISSTRGYSDYNGFGGVGGQQYQNTDIDYSQQQGGGQFGGGGFGGGGFGGGFGGGGWRR